MAGLRCKTCSQGSQATLPNARLWFSRLGVFGVAGRNSDTTTRIFEPASVSRPFRNRMGFQIEQAAAEAGEAGVVSSHHEKLMGRDPICLLYTSDAADD